MSSIIAIGCHKINQAKINIIAANNNLTYSVCLDYTLTGGIGNVRVFVYPQTINVTNGYLQRLPDSLLGIRYNFVPDSPHTEKFDVGKNTYSVQVSIDIYGKKVYPQTVTVTGGYLTWNGSSYTYTANSSDGSGSGDGSGDGSGSGGSDTTGQIIPGVDNTILIIGGVVLLYMITQR